MMEAVHTSETSVNFNVATWRYIPEDCKLLVVLYVECSPEITVTTYTTTQSHNPKDHS
jgi:hypothetical protein